VTIVNRYKRDYPRYAQAILMASAYLTYSFLPVILRRELNSLLSSLKKRIFVHTDG